MKSSAIKIGNRTYAIACIDDESFSLLMSKHRINDDEIKSFVDYDEQIIVIRKSLTDEHKKELILHEIFHACLEDSGVVQDEHAEKFISILAPRFSCIVNDIISVIDELT